MGDNKPIAEMIWARWASARPFMGTADETIRHKLAVGALTAAAETVAMRELSIRDGLSFRKPAGRRAL